jgi:hypothetical protein
MFFIKFSGKLDNPVISPFISTSKNSMINIFPIRIALKIFFSGVFLRVFPARLGFIKDAGSG